MTKEIKSNKALRIFTFILVSITILGILTIFLKTDYAKLYTIWFIKRYRQIEKIYNNLNVDQKKKLHDLIKTAASKTQSEAAHALALAGVKTEHAVKIVEVGSVVVKKVIKEVKKVK